MKNDRMKPIRLDQRLVQLGLAKSRERAKELILDGHVRVDGQSVKTPSKIFELKTKIEVDTPDMPWVSRGALKLLKAFEVWPIDVTGSVCLDIGASTGGFTEVLLSKNAKKMYTLDVGHDQLAPRLREHPRVRVLEGKNVRDAKCTWFDEPIDFIATDVSFISLRLVLPKMRELLHPNGSAVVLIKPQFEVGKERIKKGIVRNQTLHVEVVEMIQQLAVAEGFIPVSVVESPIKGMHGNKEFLLYLKT